MKAKLAVLVCAATSALVSFGAIRAVTPVAWDGKPDCWQMKRHEGKLASIKKSGGAPVVFIGDSITHLWERKGGGGVELNEELKKTYSIGGTTWVRS